MVQPKNRRLSTEAYADTAKQEAIADATGKYGGLPGRVSILEEHKWYRGVISNAQGQDLNNFTTSGYTGFLVGSIPNMPFSGVIGGLTVLAFGTGGVQEFTTWEAVPRKVSRRWSTSAGVVAFSAWTEGGLAARVVTLETDKWKRSNLPGGTDFDTVFTLGAHPVLATSHQNQPTPQLGELEVFPVNTWFIQRYTTSEPSPVTYVRRYASNVWSTWTKQPTRAELDALTSRISALEDSGAPVGKSGMKVVPLTMTAPGTPLSTSSTTDGSVRWVRQYAVMPKRVRIHVSNRNTGNSLAGTNLSLSAIRVGVGDALGGYSNGVVATSGGTIPGGVNELVTPWVTIPELEDGGFINVTVSWYVAGANVTLQHNQGGGWTAPDDSHAGEADVTTSGAWTRSQTTPLHCWIEAEVPANTPVLLANGDSITVGTATADPVGDSWAAKYAYDNGALPVILAMHGSTMANWTAGAVRWSQYGTFALSPVVDAIVTTLGQNDLAAAGMDLATLQARHTAFMTALRGVFPKQPVYLGAITPSNKNATLEQLRRDFNTWRAESAQRERGVLDFATVVGGSADEDLLPEYSADGLHPNTAGQMAMAALVSSLPVTPYTLSPAKLKALSAL